MRTIPRTLKNILSLSTAELASRLLSVVYSVYLARVLFVESYGIYGTAKYLVAYFVILATLGLDSIGTREVATKPKEMKNIVNNIFTLRLVLAFIGYILLAIITYFLDKPPIEKATILLFGLNIFANNTLLNWVFQALEKLEVFAVRSIITNLLNFLGIILFVKNPSDIKLTAIIIVASASFNSILMIIYYIRNYQTLSLKFNFPLWKEYLKQSIPIGITFLLSGFYNYIPFFILNVKTNNYYSGLYTAAFNVLIVATLLSSVIQTVYYPIFSKKSSKEDRLSIIKQYSKLTFSIGTYLPMFLFVFADKIIMLFGKDYASAMPTIRLLMVSVLIIYYSITFFSPLIAWKYERKVIIGNFVGLIVNLILNLVLVPILFERGSAIAAIITEISVFIVFAIIFFPIFKTLLFGQYLRFFLISAASTLPFLLINIEFLNSLPFMIISFIIFLALIFLTKTITLQEIKFIKKDEV